MYTVLEILNLTVDYLQKMKIESPRRQAEELIGEALGIGRMGIYLEFDRPLTDSETDRCREWLKRRSKGEPLQYISGKIKFFDCDLKLTRDVLIPRQETEILVEKIIKNIQSLDYQGKTLWDVCCGSGALAIAIKKRLPGLKVIASDISSAALDVARENAKINDVEIEFLQGDLLLPFGDKKVDFFVCNPPYIAESEYGTLDQEVRLFEPKGALVSGETGLEFYRRLAEDLPAHLRPGGLAWFEMGTGQGELVKNIFNDSKWKQKKVESDWAGHDRFFSLELE